MRGRAGLLALLVAAPFVLGVTSGMASGRPAANGEKVFTVSDPRITESSGLVVLDAGFATVNDSGSAGEVFLLDPATGDTIGVSRWSDDPTDVEAIAPAGDGEVWVGDIGDNLGRRDSVGFARVPVQAGERSAAATALQATYPDQARDAETLLRNPVDGRLFVVTKHVLGGRAFVVPALEAGRTVRMRQVGEGLLQLATDGAFFPDGRHVILRNYGAAAVYTFPGWAEVGRFSLPAQEQGEGLAVAPDGASVYLSSEGAGQPVLQVELPPAIAERMAAEPPTSSTPTPEPSATPTATAPRDERPEDSGPRSPWGWVAGGGLMVVALLVLLRALRPR